MKVFLFSTKVLLGLEHLLYESDRAGTLHPGEEKAQGYPINIFKYLMTGNEDGGAKLSSVMPSDRTRSNGYKVKKSI